MPEFGGLGWHEEHVYLLSQFERQSEERRLVVGHGDEQHPASVSGVSFVAVAGELHLGSVSSVSCVLCPQLHNELTDQAGVEDGARVNVAQTLSVIFLPVDIPLDVEGLFLSSFTGYPMGDICAGQGLDPTVHCHCMKRSEQWTPQMKPGRGNAYSALQHDATIQYLPNTGSASMRT